MSILLRRDCKGIFVLMCLEVLVLHTGTSLVKAQGTSYFRFFSKLQRFIFVEGNSPSCSYVQFAMEDLPTKDLVSKVSPKPSNILRTDVEHGKLITRGLCEKSEDNVEHDDEMNSVKGCTQPGQINPKQQSWPFSSFLKSKRKTPPLAAKLDSPSSELPKSTSLKSSNSAGNTDSKELAGNILTSFKRSSKQQCGHPFSAFQLRHIAAMYNLRMKARLPTILRVENRDSCAEYKMLDVDDDSIQSAVITEPLNMPTLLDSEPSGVEGDSKPHHPVASQIDELKPSMSLPRDVSVLHTPMSEESTSSHSSVSSTAVGEGRRAEVRKPRATKTWGKAAKSTHTCERHGHEMADLGATGGEGPKRQDHGRVVPDAFVAVRINSPAIKSSLEEIQGCLLEKNKKLKHALVSLDKLHITMMVFRLGEETERIEQAKLALEEAACRIASLLTSDEESGPTSLKLSFKGVGAFSDRVLFASLDKSNERMISDFQAIADTVRTTFKEAGIETTDKRKFNPHLTVAKLSGLPRRKEFKSVRIRHQYYEDYMDTFHGTAEISGLELLSMTRPPTEDGYYYAFSRSSWIPEKTTNSN